MESAIRESGFIGGDSGVKSCWHRTATMLTVNGPLGQPKQLNAMPPGFAGEVRMSQTMGLRWQLETALVYSSTVSYPPTVYTVPVGFKTAFSSFPKVIRWLVTPSGRGTKRATGPAVLYAWLRKESGETPKAVREIFMEALVAARVPVWQRMLLRAVS